MSVLHESELLADSNNVLKIHVFKSSTSLTSYRSLDSTGKDRQIMTLWKCCNTENSRSLSTLQVLCSCAFIFLLSVQKCFVSPFHRWRQGGRAVAKSCSQRF